MRAAAEQEHRSIANMIEVMIWGYCGWVEATIQDKQALRLKDERKPTPRKR